MTYVLALHNNGMKITLTTLLCYRVRVVGLDSLWDMSNYDGVYIEMGMYHGGQLLCPKQTTLTTTASAYPRWNRWFIFNIAVRNIPKVVTQLLKS